MCPEVQLYHRALTLLEFSPSSFLTFSSVATSRPHTDRHHCQGNSYKIFDLQTVIKPGRDPRDLATFHFKRNNQVDILTDLVSL